MADEKTEDHYIHGSNAFAGAQRIRPRYSANL